MRRLVCALLLIVGGLPALSDASTKTPRLLVGADVAETAQTAMPPRVWSRLLAEWLGKQAIVVDGRPSIEDCLRAKAAYVLHAPFNLKPRLPGGAMLNVPNRLAAVSHITIVNCSTRATSFDALLDFASNPVTASAIEMWEAPVLHTLRRARLPWAMSKRRPRGSAFGQ